MAPVTATYRSDAVTLTVRRDGELLILEPVLNAAAPVTITVGWEPASAVFSSLSGVADASFRNNQTTFTLRSRSDNPAVALRVHSGARSTAVRVWTGGEEVIRADVRLE